MKLVAAIDANRQHANRSSAIRVFVLGVYLDQLASSKTDKFGTIHRYLNDPSELCFGIDAAAVTREAEEEWGK